MKEYLKEYCVGCGLCEALAKAKCEVDGNGFLHPVSGDEKWLAQVCPSGGAQCCDMSTKEIWGRHEAVYYGWSNDDYVRRTASSGGILTEIAAWAIENNIADSVLHTCVNPNSPTETICCESCTREEIIDRSGSRYSISHPLRILDSIDRNKKYVFIGKPCDITALQNFLRINPEWKSSIVLTLSFFCAGLPSTGAQEKLLKHLECSPSDVASLRYRGDGWPGYTTAIDKQGKRYQTDYATSWGSILGRDIMKMCRFCLDGIGEMADISCGDAWYLTDNKKPDFTEAQGRNVIFARTRKGAEILKHINEQKKITLTETTTADLRFIQTYQWERKATMIDKIMSMTVKNKKTPRYRIKNVVAFATSVGVRKHFRIFKGTIKRIEQGKI